MKPSTRRLSRLLSPRRINFRQLLAVLLAFLNLCTLASICTAAVAPLNLSGRAPRNPTPHPAVARIIVPENGATSYGSGTLIDVRDKYGLVITNWHVVRDATGTIEVVFPDGFRSAARALKVDRHWDLAALVVWRPNVHPVPLATSAPQRGDRLTIAGYGRGNFRSATGQCTQYVAPGTNLPFEMVEVNVEARQGDSGGPIFNDRGELAGVLFGAGRGTTSGSYCGRVSGFLASLAPDLIKENQELIAQRSSAERQATDPAARTAQAASSWSQSPQGGMTPARPQLAESNPPRRSPRTPTVQPSPQSADVPATVAALGTDRTVAGRSVTWHDIAGPTLFEQAKTILAVVGCLAVLFQVVRLTT